MDVSLEKYTNQLRNQELVLGVRGLPLCTPRAQTNRGHRGMSYDLKSFATLTEALYEAHQRRLSDAKIQAAGASHELMERRERTWHRLWFASNALGCRCRMSQVEGLWFEGEWWARNTQAHVTNNLRRAPHSIFELVCSSSVYCNGLVNCTVFCEDTPLTVLRSLKRKRNSLEARKRLSSTSLPICLTSHVLARNLKYDSFPRIGETCCARSHWRFVKKLHEGLVCQSRCVGADAGASRCHPATGLLRRAVCSSRSTSGLFCIVHRQQHHVRECVRTLEHMAGRSARLPSSSTPSSPVSDTSKEPGPPAISRVWRRCHG